jgi:ribonuclease HI
MLNAFPWISSTEVIDPGIHEVMQLHCFLIPNLSQEAALERADKSRRDSLCVYTDGSGYQGMVGAAAIMTKQTSNSPPNVAEYRRHCLGTLDNHTVFEGELLGTILALDIIHEKRRTTNATILLDNQAAIQALWQRRPSPGQYLVREFYAQINRLLEHNSCLSIKVGWVPGHKGNIGNELADKHAKTAALGDYAPPHHRSSLLEHPLPASSSALKAMACAHMTEEWNQEWTMSPRGHCFAATIDKNPPRPHLHRYLLDLPRRQASILMQLPRAT